MTKAMAPKKPKEADVAPALVKRRRVDAPDDHHVSGTKVRQACQERACKSARAPAPAAAGDAALAERSDTAANDAELRKSLCDGLGLPHTFAHRSRTCTYVDH